MPDCVPVRIAKAVAAEINAAVDANDLPQTFTAVFSFASEITVFADLNDDTLTVDVVPTADQQCTLYGTSAYKHFVRVAVGIRRRIAPADRTASGAVNSDTLAGYVALLYEILAMFAAGRNLSTETDAAWNPAVPPTIKLYEPDQLKDGLYFGWIHLPFLFHERAA
jgi:hypothetical protein